MGKKKKPKFYVVWQGHQPGVYKNWDECKRQIDGFSGAKYKSFPTLAQAEKAYTESVDDHWGQSTGKSPKPKNGLTVEEYREMGVDTEAWAVDAACKGNPGPLEYQGVEISSKINLFHKGPFQAGTVNIGEFLAIVHALALLKHAGQDERAIYSDSRIGIGWVRQGKCNTKLTQTRENRRLFILIERAESWLKENTFSNPILKWDTKNWGEIPADFGRK